MHNSKFKIKRLLFLVAFCILHSTFCIAQSTAHDATKKNQITIQEVGEGAFSPELYYTLLHNGYKKDARTKNKLSFRAATGVAAYQQVDPAEDLDSALIKRAEIEALNMADRIGGEADLAWLAEGPGITKKMESLMTNINRIVPAGGSASQRNRWMELYSMYNTAIRVTQEAYMPNSQRKKEYLRIYSDLMRSNETLVKYLVRLSKSKNANDMLYATNSYGSANKSSIVMESYTRWRDASWETIDKGGGSTNPTFPNIYPGVIPGKYPWLDVSPSQWEKWIKLHPEYRKEYLQFLKDNKIKTK